MTETGKGPRFFVASVGTTPAPVEVALASWLKEGGGEAAVLLCSRDGAGPSRTVAREILERQRDRLEAAGVRAELSEVEDPDAPSDVWQALERVEVSFREQAGDAYDSAAVTADYTGGTKTMSMCLGLYAFVAGWRHELVAGLRDSGGGVEAGRPRRWRAPELVERKARDDARLLADRGDHSGAAGLLEAASERLHEIAPKRADRLGYEALQHRVCEAWQRLDFQQAVDLVGKHPKAAPGKEFIDRLEDAYKEQQYVQRFIQPVSRRAGEGATCEWSLTDSRRGWKVVAELLATVVELVYGGRLTEALARLYRATELVAQLRLARCYGVVTGDVDVARLEALGVDEGARRRLGITSGEEAGAQAPAGGRGRVQLGLRKAWELLSELDDPVAKAFLGSTEGRKDDKWLKDALEVRNQSVLAHGLRATTADDWQRVGEDWERRLRGLEAEFTARCKAGGPAAPRSCEGSQRCRGLREQGGR